MIRIALIWVLVILLCVAGFKNVNGQPSNFTTTEDTIYISTTTSEFVLYDVFEFVNLSDSLVFIGWEKEETNIPPEWDAQVALPPNYFPYVDDSSGIISTGPSGSGDVDLFFVGIFPNGHPDNGVLKIHAFDHFNPVDTLTVVFYISITGPYLSNTRFNVEKGIVQVDYEQATINISSLEGGLYDLQLFDLNGKLIRSEIMNSGNGMLEFKMSHDLSKGNYLLHYRGANGHQGVAHFYWR